MVECGFTQSEYTASESVGFVTICVELTAADAETQTDIPFTIETEDSSALGKALLKITANKTGLHAFSTLFQQSV